MNDTLVKGKSYPAYNSMGQTVGFVKDNTLRKNIRGSVHFLKTPPAIAWDVKIIHEAQNMGATIVDVLDVETNISYTTTIAVLWKHGIHLNRGYSPQIALPFKWWTELNPAQTQMFDEVS